MLLYKWVGSLLSLGWHPGRQVDGQTLDLLAPFPSLRGDPYTRMEVHNYRDGAGTLVSIASSGLGDLRAGQSVGRAVLP